MTSYPESQNYLSRLPYQLVEQLLVQARLFYYIFAIVSIFSFYKIRRVSKIDSISKIEESIPQLTQSFMFISWGLLLFISFVVDLAKVGFSISQFIQMQINPRSFTYLRSGLGPLTYVVNVSKMLLLFITGIYYFQRKTFASLLGLLLAILINFSGGSKSSLLVAFIFIIIINQKRNVKRKRISLFKVAIVFAFFLCVVLLSFYFMRGSLEINSFAELIDFIASYAQEAYFSSMVINDFEWSFDNVLIALKAFFLTPIPRQIFSNKGYYGFYQECWRDIYQPGSVLYQSSTYGFLAEGHMLFGLLSPILSAIFINIIISKLYKNYFKTNSLEGIFIISYLFTRMYFYTRSGYLDATNLWALIIFYVGAKSFFYFMRCYIRKER